MQKPALNSTHLQRSIKVTLHPGWSDSRWNFAPVTYCPLAPCRLHPPGLSRMCPKPPGNLCAPSFALQQCPACWALTLKRVQGCKLRQSCEQEPDWLNSCSWLQEKINKILQLLIKLPGSYVPNNPVIIVTFHVKVDTTFCLPLTILLLSGLRALANQTLRSSERLRQPIMLELLRTRVILFFLDL